MFTGLIESVGEVAHVEPRASGQRLHVRTSLAAELATGESLAVNGACLTVTGAADGCVLADIGPETARVTTLGSMHVGRRVNLERAMRADSRFGGHFVQGHVDGTGIVRQVRPDGDTYWITIAFNEELAQYLIRKGSIAVDGISLTIADLRDREFDVMIVPFTWEQTSLSNVAPGDAVNLECDMVGKYVARAAEIAGVGRLKPAPTS
jgi:riboflavin synthase